MELILIFLIILYFNDKNILYDIYIVFMLYRDFILKFFIDIVYEFLVGLFDCYYFCFKVFFVILRDGENLVVLWGWRECGGG